MRGYWCFFKIKFINGLQYRAAAYAGIATQFAWGFMYIMLYHTFYSSNPTAAPMKINQLTNYIWLQQSFLALFFTWFLDNEIFNLITSGNVAYEICRPLDLYNMWFAKNCANRLSRVILRCFPILIIAYFLPGTYRFTLPNSMMDFILFLFAMIAAFIVVVAYCMLVYIFTFYTTSPVGVRMVMLMTADFFSGGLVPLPFLPNWLTKYVYLTPFAAMQNVPFRIYSGNLQSREALTAVALQVFWAIVIIFFGKFAMTKAMKKVVVQGG